MEKKNAPNDQGKKQADIIREPLVIYKSYHEDRSAIKRGCLLTTTYVVL